MAGRGLRAFCTDRASLRRGADAKSPRSRLVEQKAALEALEADEDRSSDVKNKLATRAAKVRPAPAGRRATARRPSPSDALPQAPVAKKPKSRPMSPGVMDDEVPARIFAAAAL